MRIKIMSIHLLSCLEMAHMATAMLDDNALSGQRCVVELVLWWTRLATRFLAWMSAQSLRMKIAYALISRVSPGTDTFGQDFEHLGLLQQRDIRHRTGHTVRNVTDVSIPIYAYLGLASDLLLLARIVLIRFLLVLGTPNTLLEAVNSLI